MTSSSAVHRARRERLLERIPEGVILVRGAAPDGVNQNFFYLTGVREPRGALLLAAQGVRTETGREHPGPNYVHGRMARQVLFLPAPDALAARWGEDSAATVESVRAEAIGVDAVMDVAKLDALLTTALAATDVFHCVRSCPPGLSISGNVDTAFIDNVRRNFFGLRVEDATGHVAEMRCVKDAGEIEAIERSIRVTGQAILRVMEVARPGMREAELEGELTRIYRANSGTHAFDPIVAAGPNAMLLHYMQNSGAVGEGQLVLLDTGVSINGYKSDVTRTFPVAGKFTDRQREVYRAVLRAQQAAIALCHPGALIGDIHAGAFKAIEGSGFAEYFVHGTSHHLGLETHDVGDVHRPLEAGAVITVEPGIYLADEGLGVRIEDDVLITPDGPRVLSGGIPSSVEEVERAAAGS